jgi:hypothetical protein
MASKKLRVIAVFEFDGIDDPDSDAADEAVEVVQKVLSTIYDWAGYENTAAWVDEAETVDVEEG